MLISIAQIFCCYVITTGSLAFPRQPFWPVGQLGQPYGALRPRLEPSAPPAGQLAQPHYTPNGKNI